MRPITELTVTDEHGNVTIRFPPEMTAAYQAASYGNADALQTILASHEAIAISRTVLGRRLAQAIQELKQARAELDDLRERPFIRRVYDAITFRADWAKADNQSMQVRLHRGWVGRILRALKII